MNFRVEGYTGPLNEEDAAEFVRPYFAEGVSISISAMVSANVDVTDLKCHEPQTIRGAAAIIGTASMTG